MRSVSSRVAALAVASLVGLAPSRAHASACCGEAAIGDRLLDGELIMSALRVSVRPRFGSFDRDAAYVGTEATDVTTDVSGTVIVRVADPLELGVTLPFVVNAREANGVEGEVDAGLGDVTAFVTLTVLRAFEDRYAPGLSFSLSATTPTGAPPEDSRTPLASDVFGEGRGRFGLATTVDKIIGEHLAVRADGAAFLHVVPGRDPAEERSAPSFLVSLGAGPILSPMALVIGAALEVEASPSERRRVDVFASGVFDLARNVALTADLRSPLPVDVLSRDDRAVVRVTAGLRIGAME